MNYRGPKNPDDFRVDYYRSRHYWDPLPADELRPEGPMPVDKKGEPIKKHALPAQSTIMKAIPADALLWWATKKVAEYAVDERRKWENLDRDDAIELVAKAHRKASTKAADRGTGVHEYIEAKLEGTELDLSYVDEDALAYFPIVDQFFEQQEPELLLAEVVGIGERHGVTTDAILRLPNLEVELAVADWKTRNDTVKKPHVVYEKEVAQLGANLDLRYWIVEDETGAASRMALPALMGAVLVTFTTKSYAVHRVDPELAVAGFRDVLAWHGAMKRLPNATKGVKIYELAPSVSPSPVPEAPAQPETEISPEIEAPTVSEAHDGMIADNLRTRIEKLVENGHEETLVAAWPIAVGLSDATPDQYGDIEKTLDRVEAKVGAPFDPPPTEPVVDRWTSSVRGDEVPEPKPTVDEGVPVEEHDLDTVRTAYDFLEADGRTWIENIAGRVGNLSISEKASERRLLLGYALCRLAVAGWHDDELLVAVLDDASVLSGAVPDDPAPVLAGLSAAHARRVSDVVGELVADRLKFSVSPETGRMRLVAA